MLAFGLERNVFDHAFAAESKSASKPIAKPKAASKPKAKSKTASKKPGKKGVAVNRLSGDDREAFVGGGGSRHTEWKAWQDFDAATVLPLAQSQEVREA